MKKGFELKAWMTENRDVVISKYEELKSEKFFNGISLKDFMMAVYNMMNINNPRSAKRAGDLLPFLMGNVYFENSKVTGNDKVTDTLKAKYEGTAFMALV